MLCGVECGTDLTAGSRSTVKPSLVYQSTGSFLMAIFKCASDHYKCDEAAIFVNDTSRNEYALPMVNLTFVDFECITNRQ